MMYDGSPESAELWETFSSSVSYFPKETGSLRDLDALLVITIQTLEGMRHYRERFLVVRDSKQMNVAVDAINGMIRLIDAGGAGGTKELFEKGPQVLPEGLRGFTRDCPAATLHRRIASSPVLDPRLASPLPVACTYSDAGCTATHSHPRLSLVKAMTRDADVVQAYTPYLPSLFGEEVANELTRGLAAFPPVPEAQRQVNLPDGRITLALDSHVDTLDRCPSQGFHADFDIFAAAVTFTQMLTGSFPGLDELVYASCERGAIWGKNIPSKLRNACQAALYVPGKPLSQLYNFALAKFLSLDNLKAPPQGAAEKREAAKRLFTLLHSRSAVSGAAAQAYFANAYGDEIKAKAGKIRDRFLNEDWTDFGKAMDALAQRVREKGKAEEKERNEQIEKLKKEAEAKRQQEQMIGGSLHSQQAKQQIIAGTSSQRFQQQAEGGEGAASSSRLKSEARSARRDLKAVYPRFAAAASAANASLNLDIHASIGSRVDVGAELAALTGGKKVRTVMGQNGPPFAVLTARFSPVIPGRPTVIVPAGLRFDDAQLQKRLVEENVPDAIKTKLATVAAHGPFLSPAFMATAAGRLLTFSGKIDFEGLDKVPIDQKPAVMSLPKDVQDMPTLITLLDTLTRMMSLHAGQITIDEAHRKFEKARDLLYLEASHAGRLQSPLTLQPLSVPIEAYHQFKNHSLCLSTCRNTVGEMRKMQQAQLAIATAADIKTACLAFREAAEGEQPLPAVVIPPSLFGVVAPVAATAPSSPKHIAALCSFVADRLAHYQLDGQMLPSLMSKGHLGPALTDGVCARSVCRRYAPLPLRQSLDARHPQRSALDSPLVASSLARVKGEHDQAAAALALALAPAGGNGKSKSKSKAAAPAEIMWMEFTAEKGPVSKKFFRGTDFDGKRRSIRLFDKVEAGGNNGGGARWLYVSWSDATSGAIKDTRAISKFPQSTAGICEELKKADAAAGRPTDAYFNLCGPSRPSTLNGACVCLPVMSSNGRDVRQLRLWIPDIQLADEVIALVNKARETLLEARRAQLRPSVEGASALNPLLLSPNVRGSQPQ